MSAGMGTHTLRCGCPINAPINRQFDLAIWCRFLPRLGHEHRKSPASCIPLIRARQRALGCEAECKLRCVQDGAASARLQARSNRPDDIHQTDRRQNYSPICPLAPRSGSDHHLLGLRGGAVRLFKRLGISDRTVWPPCNPDMQTYPTHTLGADARTCDLSRPAYG